MSIVLNWVNLNNKSVTTKVYRSDAIFTADTAPAEPVAVLTNGETAWTDTTVKYLDEKYYMLEFVDGAYSRKSTVLKAVGGYTNIVPWKAISDITVGNHYEWLGTTTADELVDGLSAEIQRLLGTNYVGNSLYHIYKIGKRTFFSPVRHMSVDMDLMTSNGLLFGGRTPVLPVGKTKDDFGGDKTFYVRGRRFACGLPKSVRPGATTPETNFLNLVDANDFITYEKLAESEVLLMATQQHQYLMDYRIPREAGYNSAFAIAYANRYLVSCDALPDLAADGKLQLHRVNGVTNTGFTFAVIKNTGMQSITPVFEYLGAE